MSKRCGTCRWFRPFASVVGREDDEARVAGSCDWAEHIKFPYSMRFADTRRVGVYADDGESCLCYIKSGAEIFAKTGFTLRTDKDGSVWVRPVEGTEYLIVISNSDGNRPELNNTEDWWVVAFHTRNGIVLDRANTPEEAIILAESFVAWVSRIH